MSLKNYWTMTPARAMIARDAISPKSFEKKTGTRLQYTLHYWHGFTHMEIPASTMDDLIFAILGSIEDGKTFTVVAQQMNDNAFDYIVGQGLYERCPHEESDLLACRSETGEARGLSEAINERWRMQTKGDA